MNLSPYFAGLLLCTSAAAVAGDAAQYYVKPYAGISYMNDVSGQNAASPVSVELDNGMVLGGAFGYRYNPHWAAEIAWEYRSNKSETTVGALRYPEGNYASNIFFINGLYHFNPLANWQPYVGVGIGWMQEIDIDLELNGVEQSYSNSGALTYQGFIGLEYQWSPAWTVFTEFRHAGGKSGLLKHEQTKAALGELQYKPFTWQFGVKFAF